MFLWAIYIFPRSVHLFSCSRKGRPTVGIHKSLTETWRYELGLRMRSFISGNICFEFSVYRLCSVPQRNYTVRQLKRTDLFVQLQKRNTNWEELSSKARNHFSVKKGCIIFVYIVEVLHFNPNRLQGSFDAWFRHKVRNSITS
jgi:hypothetical protein